MRAARPLLLRDGTAVTTKQISDAAGIAEGTLFRAFPDKESLLRAVLDDAFDPAPVEAAIAAIDPSLAFEARLVAAVGILQRRAQDIWALVTAMGVKPAPPGTRGPIQFEALGELFAAEADRVTCSPRFAADALRALTLAMTHPLVAPSERPDAQAIVSFFLDGVRNRARSPRSCPAPSDESVPC